MPPQDVRIVYDIVLSKFKRETSYMFLFFCLMNSKKLHHYQFLDMPADCLRYDLNNLY